MGRIVLQLPLRKQFYDLIPQTHLFPSREPETRNRVPGYLAGAKIIETVMPPSPLALERADPIAFSDLARDQRLQGQQAFPGRLSLSKHPLGRLRGLLMTAYAT